jgi:hypothetical protein
MSWTPSSPSVYFLGVSPCAEMSLASYGVPLLGELAGSGSPPAGAGLAACGGLVEE